MIRNQAFLIKYGWLCQLICNSYLVSVTTPKEGRYMVTLRSGDVYGQHWVIIGSGNGLSPIRHQAITWTNDALLLNGPIGTKVYEILIKIQTLSVKKMYLNTSPVTWLSFCPASVCLEVRSLSTKMTSYHHMGVSFATWDWSYRPICPESHVSYSCEIWIIIKYR